MIYDLLDDLADRAANRFFGKYRGEVADADDGEGLGRLKVKVAAVLGDLEIWAMPCVPYAGDAVGFYSLPKKGAGVWVEFEAGDPTYPIWTGCYWRVGELPAEATGPEVRLWRTEESAVALDDDAGTVEISNSQHASLTLDTKVTSAAGQTPTRGEVAITAGGVRASAGGIGKVEVAQTKVTLNGGQMEVGF